ncbi:hypothetical protein ACHAWO_011000 [Cyclotella atomus]|uniref:JmjC domain-containing protein n=1 Tax=Cyclotella atomus TaxID=382360 RepID=A0ABD3NE82_9STRA
MAARSASSPPLLSSSCPCEMLPNTFQSYSILLLLPSSVHGFTSLPVPRISLDEYISSPTHDRPIMIRDIASPAVMEELVDGLMEACGNELVSLQHKQKLNGDSSTDIYEVTLQESIDFMMNSNHYDSYFAFCEGLLSTVEGAPSDSIVKLSKSFERIRDKPFPDQENWFDFFPSNVKPTDAIILAGAGATSTLHRDPFEWTGTSLCLEGTKIWRFIYPPLSSEGGVKVVDDALDSYRLDSVAWEEDEDSTILSAGWQSDMSLYAIVDDKFPDAFSWMQCEEEDASLFREKLEEKTSMLSPGVDALHALERIHGNSNEASFATAIQQTGDLLLIPAHCWHQTYAPVPSVAVASQRCSALVDGKNVVDHILNLSKKKNSVPDLLKQSEFADGTGKQIVDQLMRYAIT